MKKHRWTIVFTACLLAFTVFLAMDTFVLPSVYQTEAIEMNMNMFSQAEAGSNTSGKDQTNEEDGEKGKTSKSKVTGESDETEGSENTEETKESGNAEGAKESGNSEETDDPGNADETVETETRAPAQVGTEKSPAGLQPVSPADLQPVCPENLQPVSQADLQKVIPAVLPGAALLTRRKHWKVRQP